jgi:hypothetical protein
MLTGDGEAVRLTTRFRGPGMCLDIFNGGPNNNQPHLTKCDNLTGQLWTLAKTDKKVEAATNTVPPAYPTASFKELLRPELGVDFLPSGPR